MPPVVLLDTKKREFAHLVTNPARRFISMNAKGA
jgi:hypothetical protein